MPYEWTTTDDGTEVLSLWPYRSLPKRGFVVFIGITAGLLALPLLPLLGTQLWWGLLPFMIGAIALIWYFLNRSYRDGEVLETLTLTADEITLSHSDSRGRMQGWSENPYWVRVTLHPTGGPVPNYLTLKGKGREVELGAFLTEDERQALRDDLADRLRRIIAR